MANITVTAASVRPLPGAQIRGFNAGEALALGDTVSIKSDGLVWKSKAAATVVMPIIGVCVAFGTEGATSCAAGDRVSVQWLGPVVGYTGTAGTLVYASDTAAALADAVSATTPQSCGIFIDNNVLMLSFNLKEA